MNIMQEDYENTEYVMNNGTPVKIIYADKDLESAYKVVGVWVQPDGQKKIDKWTPEGKFIASDIAHTHDMSLKHKPAYAGVNFGFRRRFPHTPN